MVILLTLQRGDCTPRKGARLSKSAHIRSVIPAVATVSAGRTIATKKAPRRSAGLSCCRDVDAVCNRTQPPAQSAPSLAHVGALGERCRPGAVIEKRPQQAAPGPRLLMLPAPRPRRRGKNSSSRRRHKRLRYAQPPVWVPPLWAVRAVLRRRIPWGGPPFAPPSRAWPRRSGIIESRR